MTEASSFYGEYAHAAVEAAIERLRAQIALSWEKEHRQLVSLGLRDGLSVLDAGCGPGLAMARLRADYPRMTLTSIDHDRALLAAHTHEINPAMARLLAGDIHRLPIAGQSFDFCLARFVFQHLRDPLAAARDLWRVLKPSGKLVIVDTDDGLGGVLSPSAPVLLKTQTKIRLQQAFQGGNRLIGRRLPGILQDAGFGDIQIEAIILHSDTIGLEPFRDYLDPRHLKPFADSGLITPGEMEEIEAAIDRLFAAPDATVMIPLLMACGTKSTD